MVFSSPTFLYLFLPAVLLGYAALPQALRATWLLIASLVFYAFGEQSLVAVLVGSSLVGWLCGNWAASADDPRKRRLRTGLAAALVLAPLLVFKYSTWAWDGWLSLAAALGLDALKWPLGPELGLPIGVSFFTFQILSYVADVGAGRVPKERSFARFLLYVSLFPQLVAGPIVRYVDVRRDLLARRFDVHEASLGLTRFAVGLAKKVLIADSFAVPADHIFALEAADLTSGAAWFGLACYTLQIYFDFSGYSDMAIGLGRVFGFRFPENFLHPYTSRSITEFWRRWHVSLSTWFRDYVYIPLGGNRRGATRTAIHLVAVFLLCGLWHGAAWNFLAWGAWHGLWLVVERRFALDRRGLLLGALGWATTMLLVMLGWVLFRARDLEHALQFATRLFVPYGEASGGFAFPSFWSPSLLPALLLALLTVAPLARALRARAEPALAISLGASSARALRDGLRSLVLLGLLVWVMAEVAGSSHSPFLYFRF